MGTEQAHILSMNKSGRDVTVVVCEYLFGSAELGRNGGYRDHVDQPPPMAGIYPMRLIMTAPAKAGPQMRAQTGPARGPSVDVFNGWRITATASPARADDNSYLADLQARGVPAGLIGGLANPNGAINAGYRVCGELRNGESPAAASTEFKWMNQWGPAIVDAAQRNLCPDTLH